MSPSSLVLLLSLVSTWLLPPSFALPATTHHDSYDERLIFRPLADGKVSILFNFHIKASNGEQRIIGRLFDAFNELNCNVFLPLFL